MNRRGPFTLTAITVGALVTGALMMSAALIGGCQNSAIDDSTIENNAIENNAEGQSTGERSEPIGALAAVLAARAEVRPGSIDIGIDADDPLDRAPWSLWPAPVVHPSALRPGGPPPDGIPPLDAPVMIPATEVDFLAPTDPVVAIEVDGEARAYPLQILLWHEIVNDVIGEIPVTVTYCPLCNSALAYDRRVPVPRSEDRNSGDRNELGLDAPVLDFGTSGLLLNSSLVMYDRQTGTLWSHYTAEGIIGPLAGVRLATQPVAILPFDLWRTAHPSGLVLSTDTGFDRDYGLTPYPGYDNEGSFPFLFQGEVDGRLTAMTRMVGLAWDHRGAEIAVAVPTLALSEARVLQTRVEDRDLVIWWVPGTNSVLSTIDIALSKDVGSVGVFSPLLDDRRLEFVSDAVSPDDAVSRTFRDLQTGSTWDHLGRAVAGPLTGRRLTPLEHLDTFWFAWAAFRPDTVIITP